MLQPPADRRPPCLLRPRLRPRAPARPHRAPARLRLAPRLHLPRPRRRPQAPARPPQALRLRPRALRLRPQALRPRPRAPARPPQAPRLRPQAPARLRPALRLHLPRPLPHLLSSLLPGPPLRRRMQAAPTPWVSACTKLSQAQHEKWHLAQQEKRHWLSRSTRPAAEHACLHVPLLPCRLLEDPSCAVAGACQEQRPEAGHCQLHPGKAHQHHEHACQCEGVQDDGRQLGILV